MHVYKRPNSPYLWYRFTINGREYRQSTKRKDFKSANRVMSEDYNRLMNMKQHGEKPEVTLTEAFERTVATVSGATKDSYQNSMNKLLGLRPRFEDLWTLDGERLLSSLDDDDLDDHVQARQGEGFKANSINIEVRFLKRVNNLMRKRYRTNRDLEFQQLKGFVKCRSLTVEEEKAVIDRLTELAQRDHHEAYQKALDLFIYLIDTGVRLREATKVEWADIDMNEGVIDNYNHKTKKAVFVPISDRLKVVLTRLHNQPQPFVSMDRAIKNLRRVIREKCPSSSRVLAEKGAATIHSCRDTYATRRLNDGLSLGEVSHLLGHASVVQTQKYAKYELKAVAQKARESMNR